MLLLRYHFDSGEFNNELSEIEKKKFVDFNDVLKIQKEMEDKFNSMPNKQTKEAFDYNNDLLLLSLYSLIPTLRNEIKHLEFTSQGGKTKGDWILFTDDEVYLDLNEKKKRHEAIQFNLSKDSPHLARLLVQSFELYPRLNVFTTKNNYPVFDKKASEASLDTRLSNIFKQYFPDKNISVNSLRSSYVSYRHQEAMKNDKFLTVNEKEKIAKAMRTSRKYLDEAYAKNVPMKNKNNRAVPAAPSDDSNHQPPAPPPPPSNDDTPYIRQLKRGNEYYQEHKTEILEQQKSYKAKKTTFERSKEKVLYFLNTSKEYYKKLRQSTRDKYDLKQLDNGRWV